MSTSSRQALVQELGEAMQRYQRSVQAFDDAVGRQLGLNPADLRCLDWLVDGPRSAGELSAATGLSRAATTAMVDRLAAKGYVRRTRSEVDRRRVEVEMTEEGRGRTWALYGPLVVEGQAALEGAADADLVRMRALLDAFTTVTDRHRARVSASGAPA